MRGVLAMLRERQMVALVLLTVMVCAPGTQSLALAQAPSVVDLAVPDPAAVALDPGTTAFLAIDFLQSTCAPNPNCIAALPAVADALASARAASALVVYSG